VAQSCSRPSSDTSPAPEGGRHGAGACSCAPAAPPVGLGLALSVRSGFLPTLSSTARASRSMAAPTAMPESPSPEARRGHSGGAPHKIDRPPVGAVDDGGWEGCRGKGCGWVAPRTCCGVRAPTGANGGRWGFAAEPVSAPGCTVYTGRRCTVCAHPIPAAMGRVHDCRGDRVTVDRADPCSGVEPTVSSYGVSGHSQPLLCPGRARTSVPVGSGNTTSTPPT
jgi:hypothetical protein